MLGGRPWDDWIARYSASHAHPINRACHTVGIPLIALSLVLLPVTAWAPGFWRIPVALFVVGWILQLVGHVVEGKPPEFVHDWRYVLVGLRWWMAKVTRRQREKIP